MHQTTWSLYVFQSETHILVLPICKLVKRIPTIEELTVEDASHWSNHILVCTKSFDLFEFMATLRSSSLTREEYKHVIFLNRNPPTSEEAQMLLQFPGVYFMVGDPRKKADLVRAGIEGADKIVIMNLGNAIRSGDSGEDNCSEYMDSNTMLVFFVIVHLPHSMVSHLIHSMFHGIHKKYVINELRKFLLIAG